MHGHAAGGIETVGDLSVQPLLQERRRLPNLENSKSEFLIKRGVERRKAIRGQHRMSAAQIHRPARHVS